MPPPTPVPIGDEHGRVAAARGAELRLGQGEGAGVVDQRRRRVERLREARHDRDAGPAAGHVREEGRRPARGVEEAGHPDADGVDRTRLATGGHQPADHAVGPVGGARLEPSVGRDLVVLRGRPT